MTYFYLALACFGGAGVCVGATLIAAGLREAAPFAFAATVCFGMGIMCGIRSAINAERADA